MNDIVFRSATRIDLPILKEFEQGIVDAERPYDSSLKSGSIQYYDLNALITSTESEVIVATKDSHIIGSAYITIKEARPYVNHTHYGYLGFMFVKPEFRGQGINKRIIEQLKNWALQKDIHVLRLDVYNDNVPAIAAYEKAGFSRHLINMSMDIR